MKLFQAPLLDQKQHLQRLLKQGTVMLLIDARYPEVKVPDQFKNNSQLPINFDYSYAIPDFRVGDDRVEATLEFFHSINFFCVFPYASIYAFRSQVADEMIVFVENIPKELRHHFPETLESVPAEGTSAPLQPIGAEAKIKKDHPHLKAVDSDEAPPVVLEKELPPSEPKPVEDKKEKKEKKKGHLKLVT